MNNERIVSIGTNSMIYHKPGCRYVERIKNQNKMILPKHNAKREGYHVCRYCNSMNHHFRVEQQTLDYIYEHDKYKAAIERGETVTSFSSRKYARNEAKAQRKRANRRVDYLFRMLERQNAGYKELSYC